MTKNKTKKNNKSRLNKKSKLRKKFNFKNRTLRGGAGQNLFKGPRSRKVALPPVSENITKTIKPIYEEEEGEEGEDEFGFNDPIKSKTLENLKIVQSRYNKPLPLPKQAKSIKHFWYRKWPDKGVPDFTDITDKKGEENKKIFIEFIDQLLEDIKNIEGNTLIHCSAGVGRTGTLFVILKLCLLIGKQLSEIENSKDEKDTNSNIVNLDYINNIILNLRRHRMKTVQTKVQYEFILNLFILNIKGIDTESNFKKFEDYSESLEKNREIFSIVDKCPEILHYHDIKPYDNTIVKFDEAVTNVDCDNFINSSYLNKFNDLKSFESINIEPSSMTIGSVRSGQFGFNASTNVNNIYDTLEPLYLKYHQDIENTENEPIYAIPKKTFKKSGKTLFNGKVIGSQCPFNDVERQKFLKMLDKIDIKRIIMLTELKEGITTKCDDYTTDKSLLQYVFNSSFGNITYFDLNLMDGVYTFEKNKENNTSIKALDLINRRVIISQLLSFVYIKNALLTICDCKIILLYIFSFNLFNGNIDKYLEIFTFLKINKDTNSIDDANTISKTKQYIKEICNNDQNKFKYNDITILRNSCQSEKYYMYQEKNADTLAYLSLFNVKTKSDYNAILEKISKIIFTTGNKQSKNVSNLINAEISFNDFQTQIIDLFTLT